MHTLRRFVIYACILPLVLLGTTGLAQADEPPQPRQIDVQVDFSILSTLPQEEAAVPASPSVAVDGNWTGRNSHGYPVSFYVSSSGTSWSTFKNQMYVNNGYCRGTITATVPGPGPIIGDSFGATSTYYKFTGKFTSPNTATGTFNLMSYPVSGCGTFTTGGTWNATPPYVPSPPPKAFSKSSPANGAQSQLRSPTLSWQPSANATSYQYCITETSGGFCDTGWINRGSYTTARPTGLKYSTLYYWQVRASNSVATVYANSGAWWQFTTQIAPPADFGKTSPEFDAKDQANNLTLQWQPSERANSYEYCIGTADKTCGVINWRSAGSNTSVTLSGLGFRKTYFWQVRARNSTGTTKADNNTWWKFSTEANIEQTSGSVLYGGWRGTNSLLYSGKSMRVSKVMSDTASFTFTGTGVKWKTAKGPDQGKAQVLIDGIDKGTFDNYSAQPTYQVIRSFSNLRLGKHTIMIKVLGTKNDSATNTNIAVDSFIVGTTIIQDSSLKVEYSSWVGAPVAGTSGGSVRRSDKQDATIQFPFLGERIAWVTMLGPNMGQAVVTIDGVQQGGIIDLYSATAQPQTRIEFAGLSSGTPHVLQIQILGTRNPSSLGTMVVVDAFRGPVTSIVPTGSPETGGEQD